ncbi:hypothetical protein [Glutamicibacter sp.]|uniref:hypothetical protein n=1 Tax=Glutamicibacter sp. TaxID=1931995 RepID=UPI003D6A296B
MAKPTIEDRLESLENELSELRVSDAIKDSIIGEYRQALSEAQLKIAILNGKLKQANQPTA